MVRTPRSVVVPSPSCPAVSTIAPAPSPNSTQVVRSFQSSMRDMVSAPITRHGLRLAGADEIVGDRKRVDEARAHRLHVEGRAVRACRAAPARVVAVAGKVSSGVVVARRSGRSPSHSCRAARSAACEAAIARSEVHLAVGGDVALADAGALADPFVGGVDAAARVRRW